MSQEPTLPDLINYAKDRVLSDISALVSDRAAIHQMFCFSTPRDKQCAQKLRKYSELLNLPNCGNTLNILYQMGYWNGWEDTFFEQHPAPLSVVTRRLLDIQPYFKKEHKHASRRRT